MRRLLLCLSALLILPSMALAQFGYRIVGGMSNFDVYNHCDHPCDEFEIEIEDCRPEDVIHVYHNGNYGGPTITRAPNGTSCIIDYRNPGHLTAVGTLEHFGIVLRQLTPTNNVHVRWMRGGAPATVNGQVPNPSGGTTAASQPIMPSITADTTFTGTGDGVSFCVTNNDPTQAIWIKRRAQITTSAVTLEALMTNNPVVTTSFVLDANPFMLDAGASVTVVSDLIEIEDNQSAVFAAEYFQDIFVIGGPFGGSSHQRGPQLGNVMTASIAGPESYCAQGAPQIVTQPISGTADFQHSYDLRIEAESGDNTPMSFQWLKEGQPIIEGGFFHGTDGDELSIDEVTPATEGFYSCRITNACGETVSDSALVFITGHNVPPDRAAECVIVSAQPVDAQVCGSDAVSFSTTATSTASTTPLTFQWQILSENGSPKADLTDGLYVDAVSGLSFVVDGSDSNSLTIESLQLGTSPNHVQFSARIYASCGIVTTSSAAISVVGNKCQPADIAWDTGEPLPPAGPCDASLSNTGVNEGDYNAFFQGFFDATSPCDIANDDGSALAPFGVTDINTGVNEGDYNCFFQFYFNGCP